ncbi:hypothetical protein ACU61A_21760 [Pseudonocardia sichuanensis]
MLAAAAVLRRFSLPEITAYCDEPPDAIEDILAKAAPAVERIEGAPEPPGVVRWQVVDRVGLRRRMSRPSAAPAVPPPYRVSEDRLRYVEETFAQCGAEPSAHQRSVLVTTAVNHLRQVLAHDLPGSPAWWAVRLTDRIETELGAHPDRFTAIRLQLDVAVARLALGNVAGESIPVHDLLDAVVRFQSGAAKLEDHDGILSTLVGGFVDLVTAQLASSPRTVVDQLVVALARRRVRARVRSDAEGAMRALEPLVRGLAVGPDPTVHGLHRDLGHTPDGRDRAVVYSDLLTLLPAQFHCQRRADPLPGVLAEVVGEPVVINHLASCARTLEADLLRSPVRSDRGLIGQTVHIFQALAEQGEGLDSDVRARGDRARSELLSLAMVPAWPAPTIAPPATRSEQGLR